MIDKKELEINRAVLMRIFSYCEQQSKYYKEIAYKSDYKDETINRIVNLGIAYDDVLKYIELLLIKLPTQADLQKQVVGDPTKAGQPLDSASDITTAAEINNKEKNEHK